MSRDNKWSLQDQADYTAALNTVSKLLDQKTKIIGTVAKSFNNSKVFLSGDRTSAEVKLALANRKNK